MSLEPKQTTNFATKVVKDSIKEINLDMPSELRLAIRLTVSAHVYSWVIRKNETDGLVDWLGANGFDNININTNDDTVDTVTATAIGNEPVSGTCGGKTPCSQFSGDYDSCIQNGYTNKTSTYYCFFYEDACLAYPCFNP